MAVGLTVALGQTFETRQTQNKFWGRFIPNLNLKN